MNAPTLKKILYAEDDPEIQEIAKLALETLGGFTVETCSSGAEVLAVAPGFGPDLFLLDVMMPGVDGPTLVEVLRQIPEFRTTPVVFLTAKILASETARYRELGALGVVPKPFAPERLPEQLRALWAAGTAH